MALCGPLSQVDNLAALKEQSLYSLVANFTVPQLLRLEEGEVEVKIGEHSMSLPWKVLSARPLRDSLPP